VLFSECLQVPNVILLGDPGSGKTYTFKAGVAEEKATYLTVREFLIIEETEYDGDTVYLDGLDEFRSRIGDKNAISEVIKLLKRLKRPRLRLSCRVADWLGETDLRLFRQYFRDEPFAVLSLEPLNEIEVKTILHTKGIEEPDEFIKEAEGRGIDGLLLNPQTLIMLADVVRSGGWPSTKLELYERSVRLLLSEHNPDRLRDDLGYFGFEELIEAAGATCASILISGVAGVSLLPYSSSNDFPSYRTIPFDDLQKLQACLMRRAFTGVGKENVSYIHRTIAEFLAGKWLSEKVRRGLPIRRVQGLIGMEGHPMPELRGLHAWLAVLLPEHTSTLVKYDPYGVLLYADVTSLSASDRQALLDSLEILSAKDPWFRASDWSDGPLGALSGPDMVDSFRRILSNPESSFHLKSLVLDAIRNGPNLPSLLIDLSAILGDSEASYHERVEAMDALMRVVPNGEREVVRVFRSRLSHDPSSARLRADILTRIYVGHFNVEDVISIIRDLQTNMRHRAIGTLRGLDSLIPDGDLPYILDQLTSLLMCEDPRGFRVTDYDLLNLCISMVSRVLRSNTFYQLTQLWCWLEAFSKARQHYTTGSEREIIEWLSRNQAVVLEIFDLACEAYSIQRGAWRFLRSFQEATFHTVGRETLAGHLLETLRGKDRIGPKEHLLYEMCGHLVFTSNPMSYEVFEEFYQFAEDRKMLRRMRDTLCRSRIHKWHVKNNLRRIKNEREKLDRETRTRANLRTTKEQIASGQHLHNLGFLAEIYLGIFSDKDGPASPLERLQNQVGDEFTPVALEGFSAVLRRNDLPKPKDIGACSAQNQYYRWWYAILAGMQEEWQTYRNYDNLPNTALASALAIAFTIYFPLVGQDGVTHTGTDREWCQFILSEKPDIAENVFEEIAREELKSKTTHGDILSKLSSLEQSKPWPSRTAYRLLTDFPTAPVASLRRMLLTVVREPKYHLDLVEFAKYMIGSPTCAKEEQRALWLVTGFLLAHTTFQNPFVAFAKSHGWIIWPLRDMLNLYSTQDTRDNLQLSIDQLVTAIGLFGAKFQNADYPKGGWSGNTNDWEASDIIKNMINSLSTIPDRHASNALNRLLLNNGLSSYRDHLKHAIIAQSATQREREYYQPSWTEITEALRGGKPGNMADFHALILDHLEVLKAIILHSNTDIYKMFWRCTSTGRVDQPEIEDICRDRLIDLMKPRVPPGIRIEPEGHMASEKRADIVVLTTPSLKLPLELKRDNHPKLWEACMSQLDELYARDIEATGYGIYVVFWFGNGRTGRIKTPPKGISMPQSAEELEAALRSLIPENKHYRLETIVIDVSPPVASRC